MTRARGEVYELSYREKTSVKSMRKADIYGDN